MRARSQRADRDGRRALRQGGRAERCRRGLLRERDRAAGRCRGAGEQVADGGGEGLRLAVGRRARRFDQGSPRRQRDDDFDKRTRRVAGEGRIAAIDRSDRVAAQGERRIGEKGHAARKRRGADRRAPVLKRDRARGRSDARVDLAHRGGKGNRLRILRGVGRSRETHGRGGVGDRAGRIQGEIGHELVGHGAAQAGDHVVAQPGRVTAVAAAGDVVEIGRVEGIECGKGLRRSVQRAEAPRGAELVGDGDQPAPAGSGDARAADLQPRAGDVALSCNRRNRTRPRRCWDRRRRPRPESAASRSPARLPGKPARARSCFARRRCRSRRFRCCTCCRR